MSSSSSFRVKPANYRGSSIGIGCFSCFSYRKTTDQSIMGSQVSKKGGGEASTMIGIDENSQYTAELRSYKAACQLDPDLQLFDNTLQTRTTRVMSSLANGVEIRALTFESLKEVTGCLLDMNQEVVKVILECRKDIWKNEELFDLVEEYFENSLQTLDFCTSLENCLKRARGSQLIIHVALQQFEEAGGGWYQRTLDELKNFRECGSPFTEEFFQLFLSVYRQQIVMLEKLQTRKNKLNKKIRSIKIWRKVSSVIFVAALTTVLICTVVAAAMAAPPVASALAAASSIPIGSMGKWIDSLWKKYEDALVGQKETVSAMQVGGYVAIKDLDNVRALMMILENEIELMLKNVDFALERDKDEDAIKTVIREIEKKLKVFINSIEDLERQADKCSGDIVKARTVVLQRIIKYPN